MDAILKSHFLALYCMILADGIIDAKELETLYRIGREDYGIDSSEINEAVRDGGTSFHIPADLKGKVQILYNMARIAYADGEIDTTERQLLEKYIIRFGFIESNAKEIADYLLQCATENRTIDYIMNQITAG